MINPSHRVRSVFIRIAIIALVVGAAIFAGRYQILQYSAEKLVRGSLPSYITIEKMRFDFIGNRVVFGDMKILNPPNFYGKYLIEIYEFECKYRIRDGNILNGAELYDPVFKKPVLRIDRLPDGRTNLHEMSNFLSLAGRTGAAGHKRDTVGAGKTSGRGGDVGQGSVSGMVKLPEDFIVNGGMAIFTDGMVRPGPYVITFDGVEANLKLKLDSTYTRALDIASIGSGFLNGHSNETIKWDIKYNPTTPGLTMSNRFTVSGVDIITFRPYYDRYSPFVFSKGYFSGSLVFDFYNGNIGSSNEVTLSQLSFAVKNGYENAQFLETTVPDLVKYFTSKSGDIIFDFKIKGPMSDPQFFLGPISKQAVASMAIDKIAQAIKAATKDGTDAEGASQAGSESGAEQAERYIKMFKGLLKDKK